MTDAPRQGWSQSARWRRIASEHCKRMNAAQALPRCGAKKRSNGEPCRHIAMANGRCYLHGGKTPKGDKWLRPAWPNPDRPDAEAKLNEKLKALEKRRRRRAARLANMSGEERAAHAAWHDSHRPGPAAARRRRKAAKAQSLEAARLLAGGEPQGAPTEAPALPKPTSPAAPPQRQPQRPVEAPLARSRPPASAAEAPPLIPQPNIEEHSMSKMVKPAWGTPAAIEAGLAERIRTEGLTAAYTAALEVCQDKKAAPAARATAAGWIFRVAGFDAKKSDGSGKELHEMSADELAAEHARTQGELDRLLARQAGTLAGRDEDDDIEDGAEGAGRGDDDADLSAFE